MSYLMGKSDRHSIDLRNIPKYKLEISCLDMASVSPATPGAGEDEHQTKYVELQRYFLEKIKLSHAFELPA
jgi:hypothetical protein